MQIKQNQSYQLVSKQSGKVLIVENDSADNGALLVLGEEKTGENLVELVPNGDAFKIVFSHSGKAVDVIDGGIENGSWIHQWDCTEAKSQLWYLNPAEDGFYKIKSSLSEKCLDVMLEDGVHIQIWDDVNGENQKWLLQEVATAKPIKPVETTKKTTTTKKASSSPAKPPRAKKPAAPKTVK